MFPFAREAVPRVPRWPDMPRERNDGGIFGRREEIRLLREIAARLREIAQTHRTDMSDKLLQVAQEFDDHADKLRRRRR
jgi:hypothetical protein